jgi:F-box/leucine-rich repeat protein 10/11
MAPRRRSARKSSVAAVREPSPAGSESSALSEAPEVKSDDKDSCPACSSRPSRHDSEDKRTWIQCDKCRTWFHWHCVGDGNDCNSLQKWCANRLQIEYDTKSVYVSGTVNLVAKLTHL